MKYKCISKCFMEDSTIMSPGDFITTDGNKLYNITTGLSYNNIPNINNLKYCLEAVTDEPISNYKTDYDLFVDITKNMSETFKKKNHDYGNSFEESLNEEGLAASRIRIGDKWNRYKTLSKGIQKQVNDESIRDTLLDMANYAIMTVMWLDKQK